MHKQMAVLAVCGVILSACGFQPVYAPPGSGPSIGAQAIGAVIVEEIPERTGFFLKQALERRFGPASAASSLPARAMKVELERTFVGIALQQDNVGVRTELRVVATWALSDGTDASRDLRGLTEVMVAYDQLDQPYGDIAAQSDAEERAASLLAERIWTEVLMKSANKAGN
jgi:LPS-assembly lipoprotein